MKLDRRACLVVRAIVEENLIGGAVGSARDHRIADLVDAELGLVAAPLQRAHERAWILRPHILRLRRTGSGGRKDGECDCDWFHVGSPLNQGRLLRFRHAVNQWAGGAAIAPKRSVPPRRGAERDARTSLVGLLAAPAALIRLQTMVGDG